MDQEQIILAHGKVKEKYINSTRNRALTILLIGTAIIFISIATKIYGMIAIAGFILLCAMIIFLTINPLKKIEITVTPERVYGKYGLCTTDINLPVDSINGTENINNGFVIRTSSTTISLCNIDNQEQIVQEINKLISDRSRFSRQGTTIIQQSEADEIKKYKNLLDSGIITQEEFEAKKKQLLGL